MRASKIVLLLLIGFLIFGSVGFFTYELFLKPYHPWSSAVSFWKKKQKQAPTIAPVAIVDPSLKDFEAALNLEKAGKIPEAEQAWQAWLQAYPASSKKPEALTALGKIKMEELLSPTPSADKETYIVVKGDSLDRIARKKKSNAELIQRVNALPSINLQIGETLFIPQLQISLEIDRQGSLLIVRNHDQFLKSYSLLALPPGSKDQKPIETVVVDKVALSGNKRTAFGDKKYPESEQTILMRSAGNIVTAPAAASNGSPAPTNTVTLPSGFVLTPADMREVFPFVNKNTPIIIH